MAESKKVPELRFKGFTDDWEQRKLGDYIKDSGDRTSDFGKYPLYSLTIENGVTPKTQRYERGFLVTKEDDLFKIVEPGNFVTNPMNLRFGAVGYNKEPFPVSVSGYYDVFEIDENRCGGFWSSYFRSATGIKIFDDAATGSLIEKRRVHYSELKKIEFAVPQSVDERLNIGLFLASLDALIDSHQQKYDKLLALKKSMLQKLFPQNGATVPEIRLAGFTDPWEQRKLGDVFDFLQNNTLSRADLSMEAGAAKNIHYGDILIKFGEYLDASKENLPYIPSQQMVDKFKGSLLQDGDIIMADTAEDEAVGKCSEIAGLQGLPAISGLHTIPLRPMQKFASGYLGYYMNSGAYHNQLLPLMQGIKVTSISKGAIRATDIVFPADIAEQHAIGQFLNGLDNLITLHQRKYEKLKQLKQSLLEKMFV